MKTTIQLMNIPLLAICGTLLAKAQDAPPVPPPPQPPPRVLPTPKPPDAVQWDKIRAGQARLPQAPNSGYGGGYGTPAPGAFSERLQRIISRASGPAPGPSRLIIRSSAMDPKEQAALGEDLAVMSHILNKALDESLGNRPPTAMGIDVFGPQGPSGARTLYLEDYGVVYTLNVGIPLLAAKSGPEKKKEEAPADSAWEEAKRELHGQGAAGMAPKGPAEEFNAEKVEKLTGALVEALRNARNIRGLKPDDSITLCLLGSAAAPESHGKEHEVAPSSLPVITAVSPDAGPQKGTVMTVRVKKSDVDAFAKGSLKSDEFRKQVRIERYEDGPAGAPAMGGFGGSMGGGMGGGGMGGYERKS